MAVLLGACAQPPPSASCPAPLKSAVEVDLYFGEISPAQWTAFLDEEVTPRFPDGLSVIDVQGQWRNRQGAIGRERSSHHAIARAFAEAGAEFNLMGEADLFASICAVVAAQGAVSVIDPWTAESFGPNVTVRPFAPVIPYEIAVFHSDDRRPSMIASDFLALIDRRLRELGSTPQRVRNVRAATE